MINYIWVAFIVLAIGYGAYKELVEPPPVEKPTPVVVSFDDTATEYVGLGVSSDLAYESTASARIDYQFDEAGRHVVPFDLTIPAEYSYETPRGGEEARLLKPQRLAIWAYGDTAANSLGLRFTDDDGDLFAAEKAVSFGEPGEWRKLVFNLHSLKPAEANPEAEADFPLHLTEIIVVRGAEAAGEGTLYLDQIALELPEIRRAGGYESKSWMGVLTAASADWAKTSIELAIGLIGIMMLWLGMMRIAEKAGLVHIVAKMVKPVMRLLFPNIPPEGDAMGAIVMNVAANMLGLGNAATPLGIKAMKELQALNPSDEYASNAQCMLLAINTSSVTVIPISLIGYRAATGSTDLMAFWAPMVGATLFSSICAVISCKILEKLPMFQIPPHELEKKLTQSAKDGEK